VTGRERAGSALTVLALVALLGTAAWTLHLNGAAIGGGKRVMAWYAICFAVFAAAAALVWLVPRRLALGLIVAGGIALQLVGLNWRPTTTDDWYRYIWDGTVQAHGIDPYRYAPDDPALTALRDPWIFPGPAGQPGPATGQPVYCGFARPGDGCVRINRPEVHTIYPPVAQAAFVGLHELSPHRHRLRAVQGAMAALAVLTTIALLVALRRAGRDPRWAVLWAWCPSVWLECANNAHIDVLGVLLLVAAFGALAGAGPTSRRRVAAAGGLLGAAIAVKLLPVLVAPALLARRGGLLIGAAVAVLSVGYLPHVIAVGSHVLGYLPGYLHEEGYGGQRRFALVRLLAGDRAAPAVAVALLATLALAVWWRRDRRAPAEGAMLMVGGTFLIVGPSEPWYGLLVVALAVLSARPEWLAVAAAAYPVYNRDFLGVGDTAMQQRCYLPAALLVVLVGLLRRRWPAAGLNARRAVPLRPPSVSTAHRSAHSPSDRHRRSPRSTSGISRTP
jgi:Glycosyltransferase family 87